MNSTGCPATHSLQGFNWLATVLVLGILATVLVLGILQCCICCDQLCMNSLLSMRRKFQRFHKFRTVRFSSCRHWWIQNTANSILTFTSYRYLSLIVLQCCICCHQFYIGLDAQLPVDETEVPTKVLTNLGPFGSVKSTEYRYIYSQ